MADEPCVMYPDQLAALKVDRSATTSPDGFSARTDIYLDGLSRPRPILPRHLALDSIEVLIGAVLHAVRRGSTGGVINQVRKKRH